jgi:hypothetical protein
MAISFDRVKEMAEKEILGSSSIPPGLQTVWQRTAIQILTHFGLSIAVLTCDKCGGFCEEKFNNGRGAMVCTKCRTINHCLGEYEI